eukprot:jgi/Picsp_1/2851/NSC_01076-R2_ribonuclease z
MLLRVEGESVWSYVVATGMSITYKKRRRGFLGDCMTLEQKNRRALVSGSRLVCRREPRSVGLAGGYSPHDVNLLLGSVVAAGLGEGDNAVVEVGILERDEGGCDLISKIRGGQKVNKSMITKCKVGELREVCSQLGMEHEGTKPVLVERILCRLESGDSNTRSEESVEVQEGCETDIESEEEEHDAEPAIDRVAIDSKQSDHRDLSRETMFVTWLGTSSGAPTSRRNVSSMALQLGEKGDVVLVDCGEGTRNQLRSAKIDPARINHMFITHLHGDHCFGIAGGLNTVMNARRGTPREGEPFYIYGPPELHRLVMASCRAAQLQLDMPVYVTGWVLDPKKQTEPVLAPGTKMLYLALQGPDQSRRLNPRAAKSWQKAYDSGSDQVVRNGLTWRTKLPCGVRVVAAQLQHRMPCWGYVFEEPGVEGIKPRKIVLLGMEEKARIATHSTSSQAGAFARRVNAKSLVLTHFSARYDQVDKYKKMWTTAKEMGMTVGEMQSSSVGILRDEASAEAGTARVYLANDYYTFQVKPKVQRNESKSLQ